ncbi:MAG: DHHA1 domain-containing protein [Thermoproteota archaeon]|jgi:Predicted phosphohydrolase (DHH superfamily)
MRVIFTHRKDADGIICAAIFKRSFPSSNIYLLDYGEEETLQMIAYIDEIVKKESDNLFVISDIGINKSVVNIVLENFKRISESGNKIYWLDHHVWPEEFVKALNEFVYIKLDKTKCASEIVAETFCHDEVCKTLASIARDSDFKLKKYTITELLDDIIAYFNYLHDYKSLENLALKLANGILWDTQYQYLREKYTKERSLEIEKLKKNILKTEVNGVSITLSLVNEIIPSSMAVNIMLDETKSDLAIALRERGTLTIMRSKNSNIECNKIAEYFGGGGHPFIAGGKLPKELIDKKNYDEWFQYVLDVLKKAIKNK